MAQRRMDVSIENGESPNALMERQQLALDHMLAQANEENILVCMHGRALRIMLCLMTAIDARYMDDFPHTNTALYKLLYNNGQFEIIDHYNTDHLEALMNE
ncbi:histidine phosphatase family protein [Sphingobacterium sp. E70]|uniref:histidine phosphatase family protein n=1 Tax=Sphingobacterium sp. E70 TaxID=2853439 RepID=UPI00211C13C5|nr:histidine phosphatase family protein [Sphingobacterium sp. E70]